MFKIHAFLCSRSWGGDNKWLTCQQQTLEATKQGHVDGQRAVGCELLAHEDQVGHEVGLPQQLAQLLAVEEGRGEHGEPEGLAEEVPVLQAVGEYEERAFKEVHDLWGRRIFRLSEGLIF